jgi:uncharacterized delta-60 repeat protein
VPTVWSVTSEGSLDTSGFSAPYGWTSDPAPPGGDPGAVVVDDAGRTIAVGFAPAGEGYNSSRAVVWRWTPDGAFDSTFAGGGRDVLADLEAGADAGYLRSGELNGVVRDSANGIVVSVANPAGVARLTGQGALDPTFGASGYVELPLPAQVRLTNVFATAAGIGVDSKGRVLVVGRVVASGTTGDIETNASYMAVWRLTRTGAVDISFGDGGVAVYGGPNGSFNAAGIGIAVDAEDRAVVVGENSPPDGDPSAGTSIVVWRVLP